MKEDNAHKEVLIREGFYWKGKALAYEAILRAAGLFKEPPILHFDDFGRRKNEKENL